MNKYIVAVLVLFSFAFTAFGQEPDTLLLLPKTDSIYRFGEAPDVEKEGIETVVVEEEMTLSPTKAIMYALVLPGLGQGYNQKYYKIPIVWAAIGGVGYAIYYNSSNYQLAVEAYAQDQSDENEYYLRYWRRNMELSYIGMFAVYGLQVLDAYIDAMLHYWNVNDQLAIKVRPSLQPMMTPAGAAPYTYGLSCGFRIKGR